MMLYKVCPWLICFALSINLLLGSQYDPVANPHSIVQSGKARFTILTDHVIRMEYSNDSIFTDQASLTFVNRNLITPAFESSEKDGWLIIKTKLCELHYLKNSGPFSLRNLFIQYNDSLRSFSWKPGTKDKYNLKGTTRTLDGVSGKFNFYGLKNIQLEDGILSRSGWSLIDDSERPLFDNSDWQWVESRSKNEVQDLYFFAYGNNYKAALYDFTQVAGKISMPPKFAFGMWYSRYWNYTDQELKDIAAGYRQNNIPLDVLVIDMDWHITEKSSPEIFNRYSPKPNGWTGYTWEKKYFPDYKKFLAWTDSQHLQTCMNIHPASGVQVQEEAYPAFAKAMGVDTTGHPAIPFDITNKKFAHNYFDILLHPYEKAGVDFWWLDWQQWGHTNIKGVNPTFYLNYVHFSDMQRQGKRPLIFHRWGGLGNHRYQIGFSGDCIINWRSLAYQPEFTATASNVGFGYWSHDIGGHMNPVSKKEKQNPELFTRWVQWGTFSPIFRTHATKDAGIERRIWKYPDANFNAMRKAIQQRYALLPYIYTMARLAYDSGISIIRPMYYEYPDKEIAYRSNHQYFFGNDMIVAPISKSLNGKKTVKQSVWLPQGTWFDYYTNEIIPGPQVYTRQYGLDEIPVFVRGSCIIPMQTAKLHIEGEVVDTLILNVYCFKSAAFNLYEDDGTTDNYRNNICSFTRIDYIQGLEGLEVNIKPDGKHFEGQATDRAYQFKLISTPEPAEVFVNGKPLSQNKEWRYDAEKSILLVTTSKQSIKNSISVEIRARRR
ncbi:MAG: hypothetical protein JWO06_3114 [Bacteroidota bacterium]|nr:hypothetical protein [Bacteroidota bacterium]